MHYFDVILVSDVIWAFGPKVTRRVTYFQFFALKTDNSPFCHQDIPTIQNGNCVSNAVDYAKKNDVLPTICQLN